MATINHFLQRLRRHASLATVLRANITPQEPTRGLTERHSRTSDSPSETQVTQAKLVSPHSNLPKGHILGSPPLRFTPPTLSDDDAQVPYAPSRQHALPMEKSPESPLQKEAVPIQPEVQPISADSTEKNWRRLQTIIQRHRGETGEDPSDPEVQKTEAEPETPADFAEIIGEHGSDQVIPGPAPAEPVHIQTKPPMEVQTGAESEGTTPKAGAEPPAETDSDAITVISKSQVHSAGHREDTTSEPATIEAPIRSEQTQPETSDRSPSPKTDRDTDIKSETGQIQSIISETPLPGPQPLQTKAIPAPPIDSEEVAEPGQQATHRSVRPSNDPASPVQSAPPEPPETDPPSEAEAPASLGRSIPLESVWPVERRTTVQTSRDKPAAVPEPLPIQTGSRPLETSHDDDIQQHLSDLSPSATTDSSIDFVAPRRPRPVPLPQGLGHDTVPGETHTETIAQAQQAAWAPSESPPTVQSPRLIETEIGPLPSDLWELIGDDAPTEVEEEGQRAANKTFTANDSVSSSHRPAVPMEELTTAPGRPAATAEKQPPGPQVVQRTSIRDQSQAPRAPLTEVSPTPSESPQRPSGGASEDQEAQAPLQEAAPQESEGSQEESEAGPELDMDELARQVYQTIKRRMQIERDRLPGH